MALQEVCGFQDAPGYPRWNIPASLSMIRHNSLHSSGWDQEEPNATVGGRDCCYGLSFYVPNPEHLTQSPLQAVALPFQLSHGTTTLAFTFQGGVVAAGDTRASCKGLVCSPDVQKVVPVHSRLVMTMSGSAADCTLWRRILARELRLYHLRHQRRPSVGGAAKLFSHMLHPFKGTEVCVAAMLCGWEGEGSGRQGLGRRMGWVGSRREEKTTSGTDRDRGKQEGSRGAAEPIAQRGRETEPIRERGKEVDQVGERETEKESILVRATRTKPVRERRRDIEPIGKRVREAEPIRGGRIQGVGGESGPVMEEPFGPAGLLESPSGGGMRDSAVRENEAPGAGRPVLAGWGCGFRGLGPSGPQLYYVCSDGSLLKGALFSVGSGSPYAYGVLDGAVQWGMGVAEACWLAREAVFRASHRDAHSGNCVDIYHVTAEGWRRTEREDLGQEYYRERERERERKRERAEMVKLCRREDLK